MAASAVTTLRRDGACREKGMVVMVDWSGMGGLETVVRTVASC